jgi:hypothetical protein
MLNDILTEYDLELRAKEMDLKVQQVCVDLIADLIEWGKLQRRLYGCLLDEVTDAERLLLTIPHSFLYSPQ